VCVYVCVCLVVCVYERRRGVGVCSIHRLEYVTVNERINGRVKGEGGGMCVLCWIGSGGEAFDTRTAA
jgi:hypothetical protein